VYGVPRSCQSGEVSSGSSFAAWLNYVRRVCVDNEGKNVEEIAKREMLLDRAALQQPFVQYIQ
jgi:hypothetical protein